MEQYFIEGIKVANSRWRAAQAERELQARKEKARDYIYEVKCRKLDRDQAIREDIYTVLFSIFLGLLFVAAVFH